jgi:hypothetical protein
VAYPMLDTPFASLILEFQLWQDNVTMAKSLHHCVA